MRRKACVSLCAVGLVLGATGAPVALAGTDVNGFFDEYLVLGPYTPGGDNPGAANMSPDYLCDGDVSEDTIIPVEGLTLGFPDPRCPGGKENSAWVGPAAPVIQRLPIGGDYPDSIHFNVRFTPNDQVMAYAWVWVKNVTDRNLRYTLALGSDDGVAVDVNRAEIWVNSVSRGSATGTIDDRMPVTLLPGGNLIQFKVFEGFGDWQLRARLEDETGAPVLSGGGTIVVGTDPIRRRGDHGFAIRSIKLVSATVERFVADVTISVDATQNYSIYEDFLHGYVPSDPSPASAQIGWASIIWYNLPTTTTTVSYRITSPHPYSYQVARETIRGRIAAGIEESPIGGISLIPPPTINEVLITPPLKSAVEACNMTADQLAGAWIHDVEDDGITDTRIVPREGLEFRPAFGTPDTQAVSWTPVDPANQATYYTGPPADPATRGRLARARNTVGFFNWNDTFYGANPEICMNVAYFYVVNDTGENPLVAYMGVGSDASIMVRVNGRVAWNMPICRAYPGFIDRFAIGLDPGKNLIAIYTYEANGGFNMGAQFQDSMGHPIGLPTTLDPTGYDPDPAKHPDHSALLAKVPPTMPALSPLGFISRFLVPRYPFDDGNLTNAPLTPIAEDYIRISSATASVWNTFEGTYANPSTGSVSTQVRSTSCPYDVPLVRVSIPGPDKYFDGEAFYGNPDYYTTSVFAFLKNTSAQNQKMYMGFSSDDGGAIFFDGRLVAAYSGPRAPGNANCIQNPGPQEVVVTPGAHIIQGSYIEVEGGSGIRIGLFETVGIFSDGATVTSHWVPIDLGTFDVSARNPEFFNSAYATRTLGPVSCQGTAEVTLTFTAFGGVAHSANLYEKMPEGAVGSSPSKGRFNEDRTVLTFRGAVETGETITYYIANVNLGLAYCHATVNGEAVRGDQTFTRRTDICTDIAQGYYVNCGGPEVQDAFGRTWLEDTLARPSPHLTSPNMYTGSFTAETPDLTKDPFVANKEYPASVFTTVRWNNGPIEYTFTNLPPRSYEVALLFMEGCCSDGCNLATSDPRDPVENAGGCRVFHVNVNDVFPTNEFAENVHGEDGLLYSPALATSKEYYVATHLVAYVNVTDLNREIVVQIEDLGDGNPPENSSIQGIAIRPLEKQFRRGDPDDTGTVNITDGIYVLNYLFLGGRTPTCMEASDANDDGGVDVTDGIYILNFLFLGGRAPPAPGPYFCGPDRTGNGMVDIGCDSYKSC